MTLPASARNFGAERRAVLLKRIGISIALASESIEGSFCNGYYGSFDRRRDEHCERRYDAVQHDGYEPGDFDVPRLAAAAQRLVWEIDALRTELDCERARARHLARPDAPRVEGHPLYSGRHAGGRRDFLAGRAVHAGQRLYLLTELGWLSVRYESNMPKGPALLYFHVPGAYDESVIAAPAGGIRLAWPDELKRPTRSLFDRSDSSR